jgi:hypothetical protein
MRNDHPNLLTPVAESGSWTAAGAETVLRMPYRSFDRILLSLWDVLEVIAAFSLNQWSKEKSSTAEYRGIRFRHRRS